ncbi:MAG: tetratricopeptide repeat protein [Deltaproteobacteria bacterium]|nr:tetratricopeptide repeat protein [Deltaproteobacteria bacterium]
MTNLRKTETLAWFLGLALVVLTLAVYWQVQGHEFLVWDDYEYVVDNPHVRSGLTLENIAWAFTSSYASNWHPLTWLSHMLDCELYGLNPMGHHLNNLLLHLINTILLFVLFHRMTHAPWQSAFVAAVFALHPLHVESVAWVSERKDVLAAFFWMLTCLTYVGHTRRPRPGTYFLCLVLFAMGLASKPMLVTLPFCLLLLDTWPLRRDFLISVSRPSTSGAYRFLNLAWQKTPFWVLAAASGLITLLVSRSHQAAATLEALPPGLRLENAVVSYAAYLVKIFWPQNLAFFYPHPLGSRPLWMMGGSLILLTAFSLLVLKTRAKFPYLATGWFWYLVTLLPVIGIIQVGSQAMADRYTYIPLIGVSIMAAWGVPAVLAGWRWKKIALAPACGAILLLLSLYTHTEVGHWKNGATLFRRALQVTTNNDTAHYQLGNELMRQGKLEEAVYHFKEAVKIRPDHFLARHNLGSALARQGRFDEAILHYQEAARIRPTEARLFFSLGGALAQQGRSEEAVRAYKEAVRIDPADWMSHTNLGYLLLQNGRLREAIRHFSEALRLNPEDQKARHNLQVAVKRLEETEQGP